MLWENRYEVSGNSRARCVDVYFVRYHGQCGPNKPTAFVPYPETLLTET